jgi:hypothetical protein
MSKETSAAKTRLRFKKELMVISFVVSLFLLFWGAITLNNWVKFGQYRTVATEVTDMLGGVDKRHDNWNCSLESVNCPSVRLIKNMQLTDNDEARVQLDKYASVFSQKGYETGGVGFCEEDKYFEVYCDLSAKKEGIVIKINAKKDFIGVDIQP